VNSTTVVHCQLWTMHDRSLRSHYCPVLSVHTKWGRDDGTLLSVVIRRWLRCRGQ